MTETETPEPTTEEAAESRAAQRARRRASSLRLMVPLAGGLVAVGAIYLVLKLSIGLSMWVDAAFLVVLAIGAAHLGLSIVWRFYPPQSADSDAVNATFATVATIYALLFGFVIVIVWQAVTDVQVAVTRETNAIVELDQMAGGFSTADQRRVQNASRAYVRAVIEDEWPKLDRGEVSEPAEAALAELWSTYTSMSATDRSSPLYSQSIQRMNDLGDARRARLSANGSALPDLLWVLLWSGAVLTLFLAYLFKVDSIRLQRVLLTLLTGVMALALFLVAALDRPFDDRLPVTTDTFGRVQTTINR
ncbi:bestrophin-like domain [Flindersiella endophytica]